MAVDTHGEQGEPWIGFDLDGTLAVYDHWRGIQHIGEPVKPMCDLIKKLRDEGKAVKILTARVAPKDGDTKKASIARAFIAKWCKDNLGFVPPITHEKDSLMETLYDDRVKAVEQNTGKVLNMAKFKVGDKVRIIGGGVETIVSVHPKGRGTGFGQTEVDYYRTRESDGFITDDDIAGVAKNSRAANAKFKTGDKAYVHWLSGEDELVDVISYEPKGDYYIVRGEDGQLAHPKASLLYPVKNSRVVANALKACNAAVDVPVKFEVGKVYREPWDKNWLAKVLSRTDTSVKVAIKSARDTTWHGKDEQVTLRIIPSKSVEQGAEVAKGWDWEFWADVKA